MASPYEPIAIETARKYGIPTKLFTNLVGAESGWDPYAESPAGAKNLTQLMSATAKGLGVDVNDPLQALDGGARYLKQQYDRFGRWDLALAAYNAGPNAVAKAGGIPNYPETQRYVKKVLGGVTVKAQPSVVPVSNIGTSTNPVDMAGAAVANLSEHDPLQQLTNLTNAVAAQGGPTSFQEVAAQRGSTKKEQGVTSLVSQYIGVPYVWGGETPKGFDCSGLLQFVWGKQGVQIPRTTYDQWQTGEPVKRAALRAGDAVFFKGSDSRGSLPGHVGIYIGGNKFIEAPHTGASVRVSKLSGRGDFVGARRFG